MEREQALLCEISLLERILNDFPTYEELKKHIEFLKNGLEEKSKTTIENCKTAKEILNDGTYGVDSYFLFDELKILRYCNSLNDIRKESIYLKEVIGIAQRVNEYIKYLQNEHITIEFLYEVRPPINRKILALLEEYRENIVLIEKVKSVSEFRVLASEKEIRLSENKVLKGLGYSRKDYGICNIRNQVLEEMFFKKVIQTKNILERELENRIAIAGDIGSRDFSTRESDDLVMGKELRSFKRGELQKELLPFVEEFGLTVGETVASEKSQLVARRLRKMGWDGKEASVAETLRRMGFVEGKRK